MWTPIPHLFAALLSVGMTASGALAQQYPVRPIRFVVGLGPGSGMDTNTRFIAERLQASLKQPMVVENKTGANTLIATQAVLAAPPDGYTVLVLSPGSMVMNPLRMTNIGYEPLKNLRFVGGLNKGAAVLVVGGSSRFQEAQALFAAARKAPGQVSMGYYSDSYQVGVRLLEERSGVRFNSIPYKGASALLPDLLGGSIDSAFVSASAALRLIETGKLKGLAISTMERSSSPALSSVPTFHESGVKDFEYSVWLAFGVRANTPEAVVSTLRDAIQKEVESARFRDFLARQGGERPFLTNGEQFITMVQRETESFKSIAPRLQ